VPIDRRILFHQSDASIGYAFDWEGDPLGRLYLDNADAYYSAVVETRQSREPDASSLEWVVGDMEEMIKTAWDCLGASERGKALASPEIEKLIDSYRATRLW
jgi:hypothetical protein